MQTLIKFTAILTLFVVSASETKTKIIGNPENYNILVTVEIDSHKKTENISFDHVVSQQIDFRLAAKTLKTEIVNGNDMKGYVLSGISELESSSQKIYQLDFYKSNGSPEINIYYTPAGLMLLKTTSAKDQEKYVFIGKGITTKFLDSFVLVKQYDIFELY